MFPDACVILVNIMLKEVNFNDFQRIELMIFITFMGGGGVRSFYLSPFVLWNASMATAKWRK